MQVPLALPLGYPDPVEANVNSGPVNVRARTCSAGMPSQRKRLPMSENTVPPAPHQVTVEVGGRPLILETGKIAKQANGAITARYGDTIVLTTACMASAMNARDFLPLTVDYRENTSSAGKIPGGFFKRESRPSEKKVLTSRLLDRPFRPLFPQSCADATQFASM